MKSKKNEKIDLRKKSFLFFQLGLAFMLATSLLLIEFKTYEIEVFEDEPVELSMLDNEDVPITDFWQTPTPPPPPPPDSDNFEISNDEPEFDMAIIDFVEPQLYDIPSADNFDNIEPIEVIEEYNIDNIQEVPIFPGCEKEKTNEGRKACMSKKINQFVSRKFNTGLGMELGLKGVNRVYVQFKIDEKGNVINVKAQASHPVLLKEGKRVIDLLPEMKPGKQGGRPVGVIYTLPISFKVQD